MKAKVSQDEPPIEEHIAIPFHDLLPSEIDVDEDLSLINETTQYQRRMNDQDLFRVYDLDGDEVFVDVTTGENVE
uniref:Uncharacterized protein n=1 Tax=Tanacetum cinerariifolium TaxID=118510 RepID=A0A699S2T2_TANCI|nr:hypothetical protein [Tanacetum cinerariifolium]